jgi:DNA-binding protein H-NS
MVNIDLGALNLKELKALKKNVDAAIGSYDEKAKREARVALEELAKKHGFSLSELASVKKPRAKRAPSSVLYKNPKGDQTWTGRGRKPQWVVEALGKGKSLKDLIAK